MRVGESTQSLGHDGKTVIPGSNILYTGGIPTCNCENEPLTVS
jgi:hypothetical protein